MILYTYNEKDRCITDSKQQTHTTIVEDEKQFFKGLGVHLEGGIGQMRIFKGLVAPKIELYLQQDYVDSTISAFRKQYDIGESYNIFLVVKTPDARRDERFDDLQLAKGVYFTRGHFVYPTLRVGTLGLLGYSFVNNLPAEQFLGLFDIHLKTDGKNEPPMSQMI